MNRRHGRADVPSSKTLGDRRPRKRPKSTGWCSKAGRLSNKAVQPWKAPSDKYESSDFVTVQHAAGGGGPLGCSFLFGLSTNHIPTVHSYRTRSIQHYHPHCNELANPNRATAKRTRKAVQALTTSRLQTSRGFVLMHVQMLRVRVVAKLLSRWRTMVIQDGAEFAYALSRMLGKHIHGNGLPATFVPGRRNVCEGYWADN